MPDLTQTLHTRLQSAFASALGPEYADEDPILRPSTNPQFGDYQANCAMSLAKKVGAKPRDVAQRIVDQLQWQDVCEKVDIAGPGFINLTLSSDKLADQTAAMPGDARLGVAKADPPQKVVVDYSSPNVAKEMHIGHLRSTIIGDCIARVLAFGGHEVIRQNHLGDWGTQFGMLIEHLLDMGAKADGEPIHIADLNTFYQEAKSKFDADRDFAARARDRVVKLQAHEGETLALWRQLFKESAGHFREAYDRLGILLTDDDIRSESSYNDDLPRVVEALSELGVLVESEGALVAYPEGFKDKEDSPLGMIVRKSDGGYLYATTDLAAARHRIDHLGVNRAIYVTDARQAQHFAMVFQTLRQAGWLPSDVSFEHVPFGMILGKDRRPYKTREGGTVKLSDVIDEAIGRAEAIIRKKNPELSAGEVADIARAIGIGAIKYADLSSDRIRDYVFDWDQMLSFEGNTAPYLINAYVRIRSIFRKGEVDSASLDPQALSISEPAEKVLALKLMQFGSVIEGVSRSLEPHRLCIYLYELATAYHKFYEACPVLRAADEATKHSRLVLCDVVARVLHQGLSLLGIRTVERM